MKKELRSIVTCFKLTDTELLKLNNYLVKNKINKSNLIREVLFRHLEEAI